MISQEVLGRAFEKSTCFIFISMFNKGFLRSQQDSFFVSSTFNTHTHTLESTHTFWEKTPTACKPNIINMNPTWKKLGGTKISSTSFNSLWCTERYPGAADEWDDPWISSDGISRPGDVWSRREKWNQICLPPRNPTYRYRKKWWVFNMYLLSNIPYHPCMVYLPTSGWFYGKCR